MKKIIVMFLVINMVPFSLFALNGPQGCECGTHATAIYTYTIVGGSNANCCSSPIYPESSGFKNTYKPSGGAWMLDQSVPISGSTAQSECCNPS